MEDVKQEIPDSLKTIIDHFRSGNHRPMNHVYVQQIIERELTAQRQAGERDAIGRAADLCQQVADDYDWETTELDKANPELAPAAAAKRHLAQLLKASVLTLLPAPNQENPK